MAGVLTQMRDRLVRHAGAAPAEAPVPRLLTVVARHHGQSEVTTCDPGVCLVLQGAKQLVIGDKVLRQGAGHSFASAITLPATRCVYESDRGEPYVATGLIIDVDALSDLMKDVPAAFTGGSEGSFNVIASSMELLQAWNNYLALLDAPDDIAALAPARERELLYRLLRSDHGPMLRQMVRDENRPAEVLHAIEWIRAHFDEPMTVGMLAGRAGMSVPTFNRHFRAVTSTSPLNYQKTLRLQAARHLLATRLNITEAAYAVGYRSTSQFSREYSRHFGRPPKQDSKLLVHAEEPAGLL
jgi:AraC-like DNA-binding protein